MPHLLGDDDDFHPRNNHEVDPAVERNLKEGHSDDDVNLFTNSKVMLFIIHYPDTPKKSLYLKSKERCYGTIGSTTLPTNLPK